MIGDGHAGGHSRVGFVYGWCCGGVTDAQGRRMTVTLQVLSGEGLSQPESETRLEGRTGEQTGGGRLGGARPDVGGSSDGAGLSTDGVAEV